MKSKNSTVATAAFTAAAALVSAATVAKIDPPLDSSRAEIFAPAYVEAGALAIFQAQGSDVNWDIFPEIPMQEFSEQNSSLATSFQFPGQYLVICSYLDQNGKVQLRKHPVDVVGVPTPAPPLPPEPEVIVDEPVTIVEPEPEPEPIVEPVTTSFPGAADEVYDACVETNYSKEKAAALAANFLSIASEIDTGAYDTVATVLRETADLNRPVSGVDETTTKIQLLISRHRFEGDLRDVSDHADLWRQIAAGLSRYVEEA